MQPERRGSGREGGGCGDGRRAGFAGGRGCGGRRRRGVGGGQAAEEAAEEATEGLYCSVAQWLWGERRWPSL